MTWLAIDTASDRIAVALGDESGHLLALRAHEAAMEHSRRLLSLIDELDGFERGALTGIAVVRGPGRYAGLRVGIATAQALAVALRLPLTGASTFETIARAAPAASLGIHPAGRGELAVQPLVDGRAEGQPTIVAPDALPEGTPAGEGAGGLGGIEVAPDDRVRFLLELAAAGHAVADLDPLYLREPMITVPRRSTLSRAAQHP